MLTATEVMVAPALRPPTDAVMVAVPAAAAVTRPVALTVAIGGDDDVHVIVWPDITLPVASRAVAVNWSAAVRNRLALVCDSETDATLGVGVTVVPSEAAPPPHPTVAAASTNRTDARRRDTESKRRMSRAALINIDGLAVP